MKFLVLLSLLSLMSCGQEVEQPSLTALQKQYLSELDTRGKVYMESCMTRYKSTFNDFGNCIEDLAKLGKPNTPSSGTSVGEIAVGTAIGRMITK